MTFNEIEKEFDKKFLLPYGEIETFNGYPFPKDIKSFLKQSFIKYLQGECERLEKSKKENPVTHICLKLEEITFTSETSGQKICVHKHEVETYNQSISDQITHINQQLKELGV